MAEDFVVARNPDPDSTLPFLVRLPLGHLGVVLKARETWPRTSKVYCHRAEEWPGDPEVVERVPVRSCVRRGGAIDLVLDRGRENRSQFVFTRIRGGREAISGSPRAPPSRLGLTCHCRRRGRQGSPTSTSRSTRTNATRGSSASSRRARRSGDCRSATTPSNTTDGSSPRSSARACPTSWPPSPAGGCGSRSPSSPRCPVRLSSWRSGTQTSSSSNACGRQSWPRVSPSARSGGPPSRSSSARREPSPRSGRSASSGRRSSPHATTTRVRCWRRVSLRPAR